MKTGRAEGRDLLCKACRGNFWICTRCYRGHRYCSVACRKIGRKAGQKPSKLKYEQSDEGKKDHRDRQQAYRDRLKLHSTQNSVTEHSMNSIEISVEAKTQMEFVNKSPKFCCYCGIGCRSSCGGDQ